MDYITYLVMMCLIPCSVLSCGDPCDTVVGGQEVELISMSETPEMAWPLLDVREDYEPLPEHEALWEEHLEAVKDVLPLLVPPCQSR